MSKQSKALKIEKKKANKALKIEKKVTNKAAKVERRTVKKAAKVEKKAAKKAAKVEKKAAKSTPASTDQTLLQNGSVPQRGPIINNPKHSAGTPITEPVAKMSEADRLAARLRAKQAAKQAATGVGRNAFIIKKAGY